MDRDEILRCLTALGVKLDARGITADLYVIGGAAMAMAYASRRSTRDIDAVFEPKMIVYEVASEVASELGLEKKSFQTASGLSRSTSLRGDAR